MAFPFSNVAVVGATGKIGSIIVEQLLSNPDHFKQITALTVSNVDDPKFSNIKSRGVRVVQANFDDKQSLVHALKGQDVVISAVGGSQIALANQTILIDAAVEAGVKHFTPSEYGGDYFDPKLTEYAVFDTKRRVEEHLLNYAKQGKITYTIFLIGVFFDWGLKSGFLDFDLKTQEVVLYDDGKNKFVATNSHEIGKFVVAALKRPDLSINKSLHFGTFIASQLEVLHSLEKVTGKKWTVKTHTTIEETKKQIPEFLAKGDRQGFVKNSILALVYSGGLEYSIDDNKLFPEVKLLTLDQSIELVVKGF